jgi:predicted Fe-Mo cluster-binding NifX family protein
MRSIGLDAQRVPARRRSDAVTRRAIRALHEVADAGESVVVLGFDHVADDAWAVLAAAGVSVVAARATSPPRSTL